MDHNIKSELADDGILIARIDMPGRSMNVFSLDMMDSLERLLQYVDGRTDIRAVVLTSGKQAFLAGADLDMIRMFTERARSDSAAQLHELCGRLGRLFRRLEKSAKPYVAAINGLALGGGLEVSLACHGRVVSDDKGVLLGLPEIKLGLLPGAGGTQRLPRMIGTREALRLLLTGESLTPKQALELGVVDNVVAPGELLNVASAYAKSLVGAVAPWDEAGAKFDSAPFDFSRDEAHQLVAAALGLSAHQLEKYPAYRAIMNCVIGGWKLPMDDAGEWEMDEFVRLIQDPVAGNMVRTLFLNRQRADKIAPAVLDPRTTRVSLIGDDVLGLRPLLEKGRANIIDASELGERDIAITMPGAAADRGIRVAWMASADEPTAESAPVTVWMSKPTALGRAVEVNVPGGDAAGRDAGLVIARWLRATPLETCGQRPLLPTLQSVKATAGRAGLDEDQELLAVALAAAEAWGLGAIIDVDLADVGIVIAGLYPPYAGGPFNYIRQCGLTNLQQRAAKAARADSTLFCVPACLPRLVEKLSSPQT